MPDRFWGNHKWVVAWESGMLSVLRLPELSQSNDEEDDTTESSEPVTASPSSTDKWVKLNTHSNVDVVFSRTEPGLIGPGDEALVFFSHRDVRYSRRLLTVDLQKSFSTGSVVVVREGPEGVIPPSSYCDPFLFVDGSGHAMVLNQVQQGVTSTFSVFSVCLLTGKRTKLGDASERVEKVSNKLVRLDRQTYNVFTGEVVFPDGVPQQTILDRGLAIDSKLTPSPGTSVMSRAVIDSETGLTLCLFCAPASNYSMQVTVQPVIDAHDQLIAMCLLAMCPTIPSRARHFLTNDVVRLIGEGWVLTPARRFIVSAPMSRSVVVSIGSTLGIISADETDDWTPDHTFRCWLGCYMILAHFDDASRDQSRSGETTSGHLPGITGGCTSASCLRMAPVMMTLSLAAAAVAKNTPALEQPRVMLDNNVDVVFSHSEPELIGPGDEASVLVYFSNGNYRAGVCCGRMVLTVDLGKSFSSGYLSVVSEGMECVTPPGTYCNPLLFLDEIGHPVVVNQVHELAASTPPFGVFAVSLWTGSRTKLCDACTHCVAKVNNQLVKLDGATYDVFTGKVFTAVPSYLEQTILDRGLLIVAEPAGESPGMSRAVIDTDTGLTLCQCHTPSADFILHFL
ncbi:hypothetical protein Pelo_18218 [Pelomyxa schiedti]|nr:hypothetical protein Pelo_18218 [Pelomyxa schiedti]